MQSVVDEIQICVGIYCQAKQLLELLACYEREPYLRDRRVDKAIDSLWEKRMSYSLDRGRYSLQPDGKVPRVI